MKRCYIGDGKVQKLYAVEHVFNMVGNYEFTDKDGVVYLVDAEDVGLWADDNGIEWTNGIDVAIKYAKELALVNDGNFWWKVKGSYE